MEIWDLYDENRLPTGKTKVRGESFNEGEYHIVVHLLLFNEEGELLIQKRAEDKDIFPSYWDLSVGGSAISGENSLEALRREAFEEIGFDLPDYVKRPYFTHHFKDGFDDIYIETIKNKDISEFKIQVEELSKVKWANKKEVNELFNKNEFIPWFKWIVEFGFENHNILRR